MPKQLTIEDLHTYHARLGNLLRADERGLITWNMMLRDLMVELRDDLNHTLPQEEKSYD